MEQDLRPLDLVVDELLHRAACESSIAEQDEERWFALTEFVTGDAGGM